MCATGASYATPSDPKRSALAVTDPEGAQYDIRDPRLAGRLAALAETPVWLLRLDRGAFDAMPLSLITPQPAMRSAQPTAAA